MKMKFAFLAFILFLGSACQKNEDNTPSQSKNQVVFKVGFDKTQERLDNLGNPSSLPSDHAAQTPEFNSMSVHYIELAPNSFTALGAGTIIYKGAETTKGGDAAVDFEKARIASNGGNIAEVSIKDIPPGTYEWVRASVTFQDYDIKYNLNNVPLIGQLLGQSGTLASFVGFNTYITDISPNQRTLTVNANKKQGFWAFETDFQPPYDAYNNIYSGESPNLATTVVNPLFESSPIPAGSCVVTGKFSPPLVVTGKEEQDMEVMLSFSINQSFEWEDSNGNQELDFYADDASKNEKIVDMGLRGLIPTWK